MPVTLRIVRPRHGELFVGPAADHVEFEGAEVARDAVTEGRVMFYRWYSSHHATREQYSLHGPALTRPDAPFSASLCVGSHAIVLAAMDQPSDAEGTFEKTTDGGVTGGTDGAGACVVHVLRAELVDIFLDALADTLPGASAPAAPLPLALSGGRRVGVMARAPLRGKDFEPGYTGLRYTLALERHDAAGATLSTPPPHVFGATFRYDDAKRHGAELTVAWGVIAIPHFADPTHWEPAPEVALPGQLQTHRYTHLVLRVTHDEHPSRAHRARVAVTLTRPMPPAPVEE